MKTATYTTYSESDYLAYEAQSPVRHEYIAGEIFAMTGASIRHNIIALNIATALRTHLRGGRKARGQRHHQCGSAPWGRAVSPGTSQCGMGHGNNLQ